MIDSEVSSQKGLRVHCIFLPLSGFISKDFFKVLFKLKIFFQNNCKVFKIGVIILQPAVVNGS